MKPLCVLFAGQSVQEAGMCRELWKIPEARKILARLTPGLGDDLESVTTEMLDHQLSLTFNAQRAIHAHHLGHWFAFKARHPETTLDGALGHSVGIVAALVAAEAMSVEDSAVFVRERAQAFADVCARLPEPYGMAAIACDSIDAEEVESIPGITLALHNTPGKGILGGKVSDLEAFAERARVEGWDVRIKPLKVQGPYHTSAFAPCRERLLAVLSRVELREPKVPVFMGTSGKRETDPERIKDLLSRQPFSRERHLDAVRAAYESGCRSFLEIAKKPQPIHWIKEQLADDAGQLPPDLALRAVPTEEL